ncbi:PA2169 family four-helix-bundle protein [Sphingobacterium faecium]|uniref:ferritin-like domain-containing protein n=1 Tax=Sphingobacterium faecium TaxID=34087 RepID=UPI001291BE35|nr:PA2169 family four-helix-bundle protein [Sphingobacterium faecium]MQP27979.1 PA2169 family four-helix-bundle protein [Sphingobacterium faecium]
MENQINNPEIINDLIKINNDRIEGYKTASDLANNMGVDSLGSIFGKYMQQSKQFIEELTPYVKLEGEEPTESTMMSGKLFRLWMNVKVNISGNDKRSLLESCEKGEDAFKETYKNTLEEDADQLSIEVKNMVLNQLGKQLAAHNDIKMLRDNASL